MNIQSCDCADRFSIAQLWFKSPLFDGRQGGAVHDRVNRFNDRFLPDVSRFIYFRSNHDRSSILGCRQAGREKRVRSLLRDLHLGIFERGERVRTQFARQGISHITFNGGYGPARLRREQYKWQGQ